LTQTRNLEQNPGLTAQDHTAYGQASGDIARMFGQHDQSLAQALSDRGLSNSGVAGSAFSNSLGNKNEQLAGLQTQIAANREQLNQQKLNSLRQFTSQLGAQAQNAVGQQYSSTQQRNQAEIDNSMDYMKAQQGQSNENLSQYSQTNRPSLGTQLFTTMAGSLAGGIGKGIGAGMAG